MTLCNPTPSSHSRCLYFFVFTREHTIIILAEQTTLLFSLFIESGIIESESAGALLTEYLCDSAAAIWSSLQATAESNSGGEEGPSEGSGGGGRGSIGTTLATRLLLPYARKGDRVVVAAMASMLDRYFPESDADAENLIALCRPLLEMKSVHMLDGCTSVVLCRYRYHLSRMNVGEAMAWLLKGVELEELVLSTAEEGSCYKTLTADCHKTAINLLQLKLGDIAEDPRKPMLTAMAMVEGLTGDDDQRLNAQKITAVEVLVAVVGMVRVDESTSDRAKQVLSCLEEITDSATEVRITLSPWSMHWNLLRIALGIILEERDAILAGECEMATSAFGKRGITVLMNRLLYVEEFFSPPADEVAKMREELSNALARAFVAENGQRKDIKKHVSIPPWCDPKIASIRSCDLKDHPVSVQERVVQHMLDY